MTAAQLDCADAEIALGALVLGALDPAEREQVEAHVQTCPACAAALAEIAPLPGLLHRAALSPAELELEPAPQRILDGALASVRAEQAAAAPAPAPAPVGPASAPLAPVVPLRRRRLLPLLAAVAVAVLALVLGGAVWQARHQGPTTMTASGASVANGVKATVVMTPTEAGTTLDLTLSGVTPGEHCSLVAVSSTGTHEVTSTWVANYEGEATITGSTGISLADIARFDITTPDGQTLLQVPVTA